MRPADFRALLRRAEPASAGPLAPAHGLCLLRVTYPGLDLEEGARYDRGSVGVRAGLLANGE